MNIELTPFANWSKTLRLSNATHELFVSLEVGPRVLCYREIDGDNVFKLYAAQLGTSGENEFMIRGGHRLWAAPEEHTLTYHADNEEVEYKGNPDKSVLFTSQQSNPRLCKELTVGLDKKTSKVTLRHAIRNEGETSLTLATWGLSMMDSGGMAIIPQPPFAPHTENFTVNRNLSLWSYTDLGDPRYIWGQRFFLVQQDEQSGPTKIGLSLTEGWVAYLLADYLFIKSIAWTPSETYPDRDTNFQLFTDQSMMELESLGPLDSLRPGATASHEETWHLFRLNEPAELTSEDQIAEWIAPFLEKAGLTS
ncbi:MAG: hypothetical protein ACK5NG_05295 [Chthoniobacterales bacterium]